MVQIKAPLLIERRYQSDLRKVMAESKRIVEEEVIRYLPQLLNQSKLDEERFDDLASKIAALFMIARGKIDALLKLYAIEKSIQTVALLIDEFNKKQFQRVIKSKLGEYHLRPDPKLSASTQLNLIKVPGIDPSPEARLKVFKLLQTAMGVDPLSGNPGLRETMNVWVVNNVNLIKNVNDTFLSQSEQIVFDGARRGLRHEVLSKKILEGTDLEPGRFKTAQTRANLIARDQTNKLNGTLNRLRQEDAGITMYDWQTVGDSRVRESHWHLDGKRFEWSEGAPSLGGLNPGDDYNCRCWADPVIDLNAILGEE